MLALESRGSWRGVAVARKERLGVNEADWVLEWVARVEAALAPRSDLDVGELLRSRFACSLVRGVQVVNAEVDVLGVRADRFGVAVCERVEAGEDRARAVEVVSAAGDAATGHSQQPSVEGRGRFDVWDRQDYPK
jgi:hypothetical protein